jgi:hypothetical protein
MIWSSYMALWLYSFHLCKSYFVIISAPCDINFCPFHGHCIVKEDKAYCECVSSCPVVDELVCGTDGSTYSSLCHLKKASCEERRRVNQAHLGECPRASKYEPTKCISGKYPKTCKCGSTRCDSGNVSKLVSVDQRDASWGMSQS